MKEKGFSFIPTILGTNFSIYTPNGELVKNVSGSMLGLKRTIKSTENDIYGLIILFGNYLKQDYSSEDFSPENDIELVFDELQGLSPAVS